MREALTFAEVNALLRHENGRLFWRVRRGGVRAGAEAGSINREGYVAVRVAKRDLLAHRIVWLLVHGDWPESMLDHADGNRSNNLPSNLRLSTNAQNQCNRKPRREFKGVTLHKQTGKYQASCGTSHLGLFTTAEAAATAYDKAASERYGEFARLNFGGAS